MRSDLSTEDEGEGSDSDQYDVEAVKGHYISPDGSLWFLLKWRGYEELTWQHEEEMACPDLITKYFGSLNLLAISQDL